jgi:hypothetical protein
MAYFKYYHGIHMVGLRKTTKKLIQDSRSPGPRFEPGTSRIRSRSVNQSTTTLWHYFQHMGYIKERIHLGSYQLSKQTAAFILVN